MLIERRLKAVGRRLSSLREELRIAEEQVAHFAEVSDDTRIRSLVSETPLAEQDHREAERTTAAMQRHRGELMAEIAKLEAEQDDLLDRLTAQRRA
jgi:predicted  nucleic acid-binding Zn-ribbon protein